MENNIIGLIGGTAVGFGMLAYILWRKRKSRRFTLRHDMISKYFREE